MSRTQRLSHEASDQKKSSADVHRNSPSQLWENLINKKDVQRQVPDERHRFNVDTWYHPNHANKGTVRQEIQKYILLNVVPRDWADPSNDID